MDAAVTDIPGYFVGRPLHPQEQPPQAAAPPPPQAAQPAVKDRNGVTAQVPGYYNAPVQTRQQQPAAPSPAHNSAASAAAAEPSAAQGNNNSGFFARWFRGCFSNG